MAENLEIGSLSIQIDTQSEIPSKGIKNLADAIGSLKEALKGSFANLGKISDYLKDINTTLALMPDTDKLDKYTNFFNSLKGMGNFGKKSFTSVVNEIQETPQEIGANDANRENVEKIDNGLQQATNTAYEFKNALGGAKSILSNVGGKVIAIASRVAKRTSILFKQIKRIALFRIIRTLLKEITKAISEGSKAMYRWSESNDKDFVKSMDNIATSFHYLRASVASALNPIVKLIEPIITSLVDGLSNAINTFSKFVAMMNGQNVYAKAIRDAKKYGDTLKAQFLGIDELHKSGDETSFNFVETAIESTDKMWRFAKNLKEILRSIIEFGGNIVNNVIKPILKVIEQVVRIVVAVLKPVVTSVLDMLGVATDDLGLMLESLIIKLESLAKTVEYIMDKYISPIFTTITDVVKITDALANVVMSLLTFNGDKISSAWDNLADVWNNAMNRQKNISSQYNYGILAPLQDKSMLVEGKDNYFRIEMDGIKVYEGMGAYQKQFGLSGGRSSGGGGHF